MHCWTCNHKVIVRASSCSFSWSAPEPGVKVTACVCPPSGLQQAFVVLHTHSSERIVICACVYECQSVIPAFSCSRSSWDTNRTLKDTNKTEKCQTGAAVCFCLHGETVEKWQVVRTPSWLRLMSDALSAGLPLPLCPAGGTSYRWHYFNDVLPGLSPWQRPR